MKRLLVFHPIIAPYRIDFFNCLSKAFDMKMCMMWRNLHDQTFEYSKIEAQLSFTPTYLDRQTCHIPRGVFSTLKNFNPDVVLVSECGLVSIMVLLYRWLFRKSFRVVSIIDDSYNMVTEDNHFSKRHKYAEQLLIPCFDNIVNVEPRVADVFKGKYGKGVCCPIIVDEEKARERYGQILPISDEYVRNYDLEGKKVLLFVGRLVLLKNLQMVIPAFKEIKDEDLRFVIVGSGEYENELKMLAKDDARIQFVGRMEGDELYAWYNIANCFVLASYQEAFGAVTNEALLGGCWCLISEKAGSQCLIEIGVNGDVFNPIDKDGFKHLLEDRLKQQSKISLPLALRQNNMLIDFETQIESVISALE